MNLMSLWPHATDLLALLYIIVIPAAMLGKTLFPRGSPTLRLAAGLGLQVSVMPLVAFALAMALGTHLSHSLLAGVATVIIVGCLVIQLVRTKWRPRELDD